MALWIDLQFQLEDTYSFEPRDETLISAIYDYAHWCLRESKNADVFTAVVYAFFEHLPQHKAIRADLPNRLSRRDFLYIGDYWSYHLSETEFEKFEEEFLGTHNRADQKRSSFPARQRPPKKPHDARRGVG